jgi:hypothetical protein
MATDANERSRTRSPGYPYVDLREAIERAGAIYQREKMYAAAPEVIVEHWGYKNTSSGGKMTLAALKKFGLIEDVGGGPSRKVKLTKLAQTIILHSSPEHQQVRIAAIQEAALLPKIHLELWEKWRSDLPSDSTIRLYLIQEREFNDSAVGDFIQEYKNTLAFAQLSGKDKIGDESSDIDEGDYLAGEWSPMTNGVDARSHEGDAMTPSTATRSAHAGDFPPVSASAPVRVLSIPLEGGKTFDVRFPMNLTKEDFDFVVENIKLWERKIVTKQKPLGNEDTDSSN